MKSIILLFLLIFLSESAFAAMIPVNSFDKDSIFTSPALLAVAENRNIPFGIELKGYADRDMINFISNPAATLSGAADYLRDYLLAQDDQYLYDNYSSIQSIFSFDSSFPSLHNDATENAYFIREYLNNRYNEEIGDGNRARAVANAYSSNLAIFPSDSSLIGSELDFSLRMYGGSIKNGFGWDWDVGIVYDGVSSILDSSSYDDYKYGSDFYFTLGSNLGYGTYISDNFAVGVSFSPDFVFKTTIDNTSLFASRISGSIIDLVASNTFNFGLSLDLNLGFMIDAGDNARILIDFRNLPSMQMYWYFSASDIASEFQMHEDDNIYFVPPDVSLGLVWDKGPWHVEGEISNIADQFIWKAMIPSYKFDILSVPKLSFAYRILDDMSIGLGYEFRSVVLSFMWSGLKAEFSTRVDKLGFGITLGYEF